MRMWIDFVHPVIKTKWTLNYTQEKIQIQQDNARPHIEPTDQKFLQATFEIGISTSKQH